MGCNFSQLVEEVTHAASTTPADNKVDGDNHQQQQPQQQQQQQQQQQPSIVATATEISLSYAQLPSGSEKQQVHHVYDGDTLTLTDQRRVRFLGIDAPELKEKQAFAVESKQFTQSLCGKDQDIWLSFGDEKEDHYGRVLAFVWVHDPQGKGWLCVNEAIVANGFATVYLPSASSKLFNKDKMIALQKQARHRKRGLWSEFQDDLVVKTGNGTAYHVRGCKHLANSHHLTELRSSEAADLGLHPCRTCMS